MPEIIHGDCVEVMAAMDEASVDDAFGHWLCGFIDGEGCFGITLVDGGPRCVCYFRLGQRADDASLLEGIVATTGVGRLTLCRASNGAHPTMMWDVTAKHDCVALVRLIDRFGLHSKKRHEYRAWREAVSVWCRHQNGHRGIGAGDWTQMQRYREEILRLRKYGAQASEIAKARTKAWAERHAEATRQLTLAE